MDDDDDDDFGSPNVTVAPAPPQEDARKKALEEQAKVARSMSGFIERQRGLGPIQLQAPGLSRSQRDR